MNSGKRSEIECRSETAHARIEVQRRMISLPSFFPTDGFVPPNHLDESLTELLAHSFFRFFRILPKNIFCRTRIHDFPFSARRAALVHSSGKSIPSKRLPGRRNDDSATPFVNRRAEVGSSTITCRSMLLTSCTEASHPVTLASWRAGGRQPPVCFRDSWGGQTSKV